jgi:hypothetical protein
VSQTADKPSAKMEALAAYKAILRDVLDARPSGTRQRLAAALGKNRSFVTQMANTASLVPVPAQHLPTIFELCRFSHVQREAFLAAYHLAHPRRLISVVPLPHMRAATLHVPDLGDIRKNRLLDNLLNEVAKNVAQILRGE